MLWARFGYVSFSLIYKYIHINNIIINIIIQPAREARRLAQRAERPRRGLSALWASRRASAQAVTSKWQLRATSPMNTSSSAGENGFSAKNGS